MSEREDGLTTVEREILRAVREIRYGSVEVTVHAARGASTWGGGVTWTLTRNLKTYLDYERTSFEGGAATGDREDEVAILGRLQVSF